MASSARGGNPDLWTRERLLQHREIAAGRRRKTTNQSHHRGRQITNVPVVQRHPGRSALPGATQVIHINSQAALSPIFEQSIAVSSMATGRSNLSNIEPTASAPSPLSMTRGDQHPDAAAASLQNTTVSNSLSYLECSTLLPYDLWPNSIPALTYDQLGYTAPAYYPVHQEISWDNGFDSQLNSHNFVVSESRPTIKTYPMSIQGSKSIGDSILATFDEASERTMISRSVAESLSLDCRRLPPGKAATIDSFAGIQIATWYALNVKLWCFKLDILPVVANIYVLDHDLPNADISIGNRMIGKFRKDSPLFAQNWQGAVQRRPAIAAEALVDQFYIAPAMLPPSLTYHPSPPPLEEEVLNHIAQPNNQTLGHYQLPNSSSALDFSAQSSCLSMHTSTAPTTVSVAGPSYLAHRNIQTPAPTVSSSNMAKDSIASIDAQTGSVPVYNADSQQHPGPVKLYSTQYMPNVIIRPFNTSSDLGG